MNARRLLVALSLLLAMPAAADPWRAKVDGPRGLPSVDIALGYEDGYVSIANAPIALRIRTGDRGFDGYVGYNVSTGQGRTWFRPVATRVTLRPHAEQLFSTWAQIRSGFRSELMIEWRDRSMHLIGKRSAGVPPWRRQRPFVGEPKAVDPQYYAGFSGLAISSDNWQRLAPAVREAIFRSGIRVNAPQSRVSATRQRNFSPVKRTPRVSEIAKEMRPLILGIVLIVIAIVAWFAMRRHPRVATVSATAALAVLLIVVRGSVRASTGRYTSTIMRIDDTASYVVTRLDRDAGPSPLPAVSASTSGVNGVIADLEAIEVRTSATRPGFGAIYSANGWDSVTRTTRTRERGTPASIRVTPAAETLSVDYATSKPVDYISADWDCGTKRCSGSVIASSARGRVTIRNNVQTWVCLDCYFMEASEMLSPSAGSVFVSLFSFTPSSATAIAQIDPPGSTPMTPPYVINTSFTRDGNTLAGVFALPNVPAPGVTASLNVRGLGATSTNIARMTLSGSGGEVTAESDPAKTIQFFVPFGELRRIAPAGGVVTARIETAAAPDVTDMWDANLVVNERKP